MPKYMTAHTDFHPAIITGNRTPSVFELQSHFALYRGVPMNAGDVGLRLNCPAANVLSVLLELDADGPIRVVSPNGPPTVDTQWIMD